MSALGWAMGNAVGLLPPPVVRHLARRYAAGATVADAMRETLAFHGDGMAVTISVLGEAARDAAYATRHADDIASVLGELERHPELDVRLGVKLSALGLAVGEDIAQANLEQIASSARAQGRIVEVDMEQSTLVDATLGAVRHARDAGLDNVHAVVQAYLHRTVADVEALISERVPTRIVKGAYRESPRDAMQMPEAVRSRFDALVGRYLEAGVPVGIGTHNELLVVQALDRIRDTVAAPEHYEFQMIMGIQESLRQSLVDAGHPVRVTVHFGADMHLWSIRRLREDPTLARHAARDVIAAARERTQQGAVMLIDADTRSIRVSDSWERPAPHHLDAFADIPAAIAGDALERLSAMDAGIRCLAGTHLVGFALPILTREGDNLAIHRALDLALPGDVLVVNGRGDTNRALVGDLLGAVMRRRHVRGAVIDGAVRDVAALNDMGLGIYARGTTPSGPTKLGPGAIGEAVACGGVVVRAGDLVVADADGVAIVPRASLASVPDRIRAALAAEAAMRARIATMEA